MIKVFNNLKKFFLTRSRAEFFHEVENKIFQILIWNRLFSVCFIFKISLRYFHGALVVLKKLRTVQYKNIIFVPIFNAFRTIYTNLFWRKFTVYVFLSSTTINNRFVQNLIHKSFFEIFHSNFCAIFKKQNLWFIIRLN